MSCYKLHKPTHAEEDQTKSQSTAPKKDRPGTTQRVPKVDFTSFENDKELLRLLERYPLLRLQLQTIYGLTLEPGPEEARSWSKQPLPSLPGYDLPEPSVTMSRGGFRGGRGPRGARNRGGRTRHAESRDDEREHGRWTQEKGDREAVQMVAKMREGGKTDGDDVADGMREFVELVRMRFGEKDEVEGG